MQKNEHIIEDEIDLKELFNTLVKKKYFIGFFTLAVTILAVIYVFVKTPIYEVKSVIRIGYIDENLVEKSNILETKLKIVFGVDNKSKKADFENGEVTTISAIKNVENFLEISTQAYSNEKAIEKNKKVVEFLQNEYKYKIDEYILLTNLNIKNLEESLKYVEKVKKVKINEQIDFLNSVDLTSLENKLKFNKEKLNQYQENINNISKRRSSNDTENMLSAMEILNYQNLTLNVQTQIENLTKEKMNIINEQIPNLKRNLEFDIKNELETLKNKIELEKLKITNNIAKNSEIVGEVQINDNPVKPKKALIIVVAFVTGFILSIFIVFFMQFIANLKRDKK